MRTIPVDLILHSLLDLLRAVPADTPGSYAESIALCINHRRVAEEWQADGDPAQAADWLRRRLDQHDTPIAGLVGKDTRTIEVAVARRLADVAFALCIEQTSEATSHATMLLRAAQAIVGLESDAAYKARAVASQPLAPTSWAEQLTMAAREAGAKDPRVEALGDRPGGIDFRITLDPEDNAAVVCRAIWASAQVVMNFHGEHSVTFEHGPFKALATMRYDVLPAAHKNALKFKRGDKVRIARKSGETWVSNMDMTVGETGVVAHYDPGDETCRVNLADGDWYYYSTSALAHV